MKKPIVAGGLALGLFLGGTAAVSVSAGTDEDFETQQDVQGTDESGNQAEPQATPVAAAAYVGGAAVTGAAAKAGADAYDWAKGKLGGTFDADNEDVDYDEIEPVFDK